MAKDKPLEEMSLEELQAFKDHWHPIWEEAHRNLQDASAMLAYRTKEKHARAALEAHGIDVAVGTVLLGPPPSRMGVKGE